LRIFVESSTQELKMIDSKTDIDELLRILRKLHEQKIPFNRFIGLRLEHADLQTVRARFNTRDEFIGNPAHGILHGGVISSVLDATGGITASLGILKRALRDPVIDIEDRLTKVGTIDLRIDYLRPGRVDYLRPGRGKYFISTGTTMRTGRKVTVVRMEMKNDHDNLIAVGTGTYIVG
jgi:uncharacterized protein (TIGR00369 family)